jgi:hypothetical protein
MKKTKDTEIDTEREAFTHKVGEEIRERLDYRHKKDPDSPLPFRAVMSCKGAAAKKAGYLSVTSLASRLEDLGYIFVYEVPSGARYVYSGNCKLTDDERFAKVYDIEHEKFQDKILRKQMSDI